MFAFLHSLNACSEPSAIFTWNKWYESRFLVKLKWFSVPVGFRCRLGIAPRAQLFTKGAWLHNLTAYKASPTAGKSRKVVTRTDTNERAYQAFARTRRITVRASGEWTAAQHLIGYPLTNRIPPTPLVRWMHFLRSTCALDWAVIHNKHLESVSPNLAFFSSWLWVQDVIVRAYINSAPY